MLTHPVQVAYAVADIHQAAAAWSACGVGPFFKREHIQLDNVECFGTPSMFDHSSAFAQWGDVMVELICEHVPPGGSRVGPESGLHHVAFFVGNFAEATAELAAVGLSRNLYAEAGGMPFAFHDATDTLGHLVEIYERTDRLGQFYDTVRDSVSLQDKKNDKDHK